MLKRSRGQRIILSNFPIDFPPIGSLVVMIADTRGTGFSCAVGSGAWDRCRNPPAGPACLCPMIRAGARANVGNALLMTEPPFHPSPRIKRSPSHLSRGALAPPPALPRPEKRRSRDSATQLSTNQGEETAKGLRVTSHSVLAETKQVRGPDIKHKAVIINKNTRQPHAKEFR